MVRLRSVGLIASALASMSTAAAAQSWEPLGGSASGDGGIRAGQIRNFKIARIDTEKKRIELEMA